MRYPHRTTRRQPLRQRATCMASPAGKRTVTGPPWRNESMIARWAAVTPSVRERGEVGSRLDTSNRQ
jgi:hypothetical protein